MSHHHHLSRVGLGLALGLLAAPVSGASAQELLDRLEMHGSLNAGYGRSDSLGVFGIPQKGTSDYRVFTMQFRYKATEKDFRVATHRVYRDKKMPSSLSLTVVRGQLP